MKTVKLKNPSSYIGNLPPDDLARLIANTQKEIERLEKELQHYDLRTTRGLQASQKINHEIRTLKRDLAGYRKYVRNPDSREDRFYVKDSDSRNISTPINTRHAAEKLAKRLNDSEGRERYYVIGIEYHQNPIKNPRTNFHKVEIGDKFHIGKYKERDGSQKYEILQKIDRSTAQVVEVVGNYHTLGHIRKFTAFETVYTLT